MGKNNWRLAYLAKPHRSKIKVFYNYNAGGVIKEKQHGINHAAFLWAPQQDRWRGASRDGRRARNKRASTNDKVAQAPPPSRSLGSPLSEGAFFVSLPQPGWRPEGILGHAIAVDEVFGGKVAFIKLHLIRPRKLGHLLPLGKAKRKAASQRAV